MCLCAWFRVCVCSSRWVRLLFGREFPLQDLLVVWDALLADSITLDLVDYVFVAMLLYIRDAREFSAFPFETEILTLTQTDLADCFDW